jgi:hypothetical protein
MISQGLTREQSNNLYLDVLNEKDSKLQRLLCQNDLFFLLSIACNRSDMNRDWIYDRCREVEAAPNGFLDLWAREHHKMPIVTSGSFKISLIERPNVIIDVL